MSKLLWIVAATAIVAASGANAQGTKDAQTGAPSTATNVNRGTGTTGPSDPMGGAMRGTGVPTYGTSNGMGSDPRTNRN